jgi:F-type H+-transporting ATPase subunit gamma
MRHEVFLRRRLHTLHTLHDAVSAMRTLSAHHFRIVRKGLRPAREYRAEIERIVAEIGIHQPLPAAVPGGLLVIASDLGLCGDYNSQLARQALEEHAHQHFGPVYSVGRRLRPALARAGIAPQRNYDAPASLDGLSRLLLQLAQGLLEDYTTERISSLFVVSARFDGIGHFTPVCARLLPIEPKHAAAPLRRSPYIAADHLMAVAVREFLYISLHELLLDALAAEHGMRLTAAEAALQWLDSAVAHTSRKLSASRSEAATQELLDIVGGGKTRRAAEDWPR